MLCLNHNRIESLVKQLGGADNDSTPILPNLQVLHLAYNGISQLPPLQLHRLVSLRALFLQGNVYTMYRILGIFQALKNNRTEMFHHFKIRMTSVCPRLKFRKFKSLNKLIIFDKNNYVLYIVHVHCVCC